MTKQKQKFESKLVWERIIENVTRKKQQVKHARLAKEIKKARITKKRAKVFVCKRCFVKFFNNIKFYQYMQNHYQKKLVSFVFNQIISFVLNQIVLFSKQFFTSSLISFSTFSIILFTFIEFALFTSSFATSKRQIFWAKIISKSISSKSSRLSLLIFEFLRNASISCFIFSFTLS